MSNSEVNVSNKQDRIAKAKPMTDSKKRRHEQILRTKERGTIMLIEASRRKLRRALCNEKNEALAVLVEDVNTQMSKELVRLRRALISERNHRERLAAGLLPRLRSKANEVRTLRTKLYGHPECDQNPSFEVSADETALVQRINGKVRASDTLDSDFSELRVDAR